MQNKAMEKVSILEKAIRSRPVRFNPNRPPAELKRWYERLTDAQLYQFAHGDAAQLPKPPARALNWARRGLEWAQREFSNLAVEEWPDWSLICVIADAASRPGEMEEEK